MSTVIRPSLVHGTCSAAGHAPVPAGVIFAFVFLALTAMITFTCRESLFKTAYHEEGDDAANALQINRGKQLRELHGNYSRWTFHHPGPAFFYVYAAGEWLLHDATRIAPAPRNAHVYSGTLLQLAFYAAAVTLLAHHSRQPLLSAALALGAGALHFTQIEREQFIYSIWPPNVLLMPFLCFAIAAAAVSLKNRAALPILVVSGSFLVHGHVAQPLFVVPMTLLALGLAWRGDWRRELLNVGRDRAGRLALILLGLFLLPLGLDLLSGRESNAHAILQHLRFRDDAGPTLWQSVLCYASYFLPLHDQTIFNNLSQASYAPFRERIGTLVIWAGLITFGVWWLLRRPRAPGGDEPGDLCFGRRLLVFWVAGSLLTLIWGIRQDGGFTTFNSDFNHSLVHSAALLAVLATVNVLPRTSRPFGGLTLAAAVIAFALALPFEHEVGSRGDEIAVRLEGLLQADPKVHSPKLITWEIPGEDWYEAVTLARAFQRRGIEFYVHSSWRFMFGDDHVFTNESDALGRGMISLWHVIQRKSAPAGAHVLDRDYSVVLPDAIKPRALPVRIDLSRNEYAQHRVFGIGRGDPSGAWTEGNIAAILFNIPAIAEDLELVVDAAVALVTPRASSGQYVSVRVNGQPIGGHHFNEQRQSAHFVVPRDVWNRQSPQAVTFELPNATSPANLGVSADPRVFGLRLYTLSLETRAR